MLRTKDESNDDDQSPPAPSVTGSQGVRQTTGGARCKSLSPHSEELSPVGAKQRPFLQKSMNIILLKEEVGDELDEKAKQLLLKETMETYKEDFLTERCERKLLHEEVNSLRQQVHLLLSELSTARQQVASKSDELDLLQKQMNKLTSILQEHRTEDTVDSEDGEKRRSVSSTSLPSSIDDFQPSWRCLTCTYENPGDRRSCCEVCGSIRSKESTTSEAKSSAPNAAGQLESDQVKHKRRKCGTSDKHQWSSAAYVMQWQPMTLKYLNRLQDGPRQLFGLHDSDDVHNRFLGFSR